MALVGGLGRSLNGSYAELVQAPSTNVIAIETELPWDVRRKCLNLRISGTHIG
jgi:hypothetical protein